MKIVLPQIAWNDINLSNFLWEVHLCCEVITSLSVTFVYLIQKVQRGFIHFLFQPHHCLDSARPVGKKNESVFCDCLFLFYHLSVQWRERMYNLIGKSKRVKQQGFDRAAVIMFAYWSKARPVCIIDRLQLCLFQTNIKKHKIHFLLSTVLVRL